MTVQALNFIVQVGLVFSFQRHNSYRTVSGHLPKIRVISLFHSYNFELFDALLLL